jgi:nuclear transcription Y subunit beta
VNPFFSVAAFTVIAMREYASKDVKKKDILSFWIFFFLLLYIKKPKFQNLFVNQDRYLPIANIARIMKNTLPENAKIAKDSKETVQECVSEFISFITSEASDKCLQEKRKTINGDDLLWAMSTLGFDKYVEPLKLYLSKYREAVRGDKPDKAAARASANAASAAASAANANANAASANVNASSAGGVAGQTKS